MTRTLVRPKPLLPGGHIGIISPAGVSSAKAMADGVSLLEEWGYRATVFPHALDCWGYLAGSDPARIHDLHEAFASPDIDAILCARGGYGCMRLLPLLDFDLLRQHPKLLIGFSDITALLLPLYQENGLMGLHGPMLTSNLIEGDPFSQAALQAMWAGGFEQRDFQLPTQQATYHCLHKGISEGPLIGGNLSLLAGLCGTPWQPNTQGHVLFIEDWKEAYYSLDRQFQQLRLAGLFDGIVGLILGDFIDIRSDAPWSLPDQLLQLVRDLHIPIGLGFSIGHGDQNTTVPIGAPCRFDAETGTVTLLL